MSKSFKNNALDNFFTSPNPIPETKNLAIKEVEQQEPKKDLVVAPPKEETKSKRVNLLIKPSTHKKALAKCKKTGISLNESINQLLENWINS